MKVKIKSFILGMLVMGILSGIVAYAADNWQNISVLPNTIKVVVNGKEVQADNFLYNDTTYLPIRAVSEALGKDVQFDGATGTAVIGDAGTVNISSNQTTATEINVTNTFSTTKDGLYIYEDENGQKYLKLTDINGSTTIKNAKSSLFEMWTVSNAGNNGKWRLEYCDVTNDEMWNNSEIYAMEGGPLFTANNAWYILATDYTDKVIPNLGAINGKPNSNFVIVKEERN